MKFRKKPVVIDAMQFDGSNFSEIAEFCSQIVEVRATQSKLPIRDCQVIRENNDTDNYIVIRTLEGDMKARKDDWIICGVSGEFYPCKPDIFEETYEPVK